MSRITTITIVDQMCAICAHAESGQICGGKDSPEYGRRCSPFHVCTAFTEDESLQPPYPTEGVFLNMVNLFLYEGVH